MISATSIWSSGFIIPHFQGGSPGSIPGNGTSAMCVVVAR